MSGPERLLDPDALRRRLVFVLTAVLSLLILAFSFFTLAAFDRAIAPELESRTRLIGNLIRIEIQRTLELGIPISSLGGLNPYIEHILEDFPEVRRIAIIAGNGEPIAEALREEAPTLFEKSGIGERIGIQGSEFRVPILVGSDLVGEIAVEGNPQYAETRLRDVVLDVAVLALAALLIGVEIVLATAAASFWKPFNRIHAVLSEQRAGRFRHVVRETGVITFRRVAARLNDRVHHLAARAGGLMAEPPRRLRLSDLNDIRLPLFLFVLATEVTASFLPVFASSLARPAWLSAETAAAAPIFVFLMFLAVLSPVSRTLAARVGPRRLFLLAILPAASGLLAMSLAEAVVAVSAARALIAASYAMATAACHAYAAKAGAAEGGGRPLGAMIGTTFAGSFCGSIIGGVIAGRFGYPSAILFGVVFALGAGIAGYHTMRGRAGDPAAAEAPRLASALDRPAGTLGFSMLVVGISVPASAVAAIFIWYLTPLMLSEAGLRPADIARVVMLYPLATILAGPLIAVDGDRSRGLVLQALGGAFLSAAALLSLGLWTGVWPLIAAVVGVGLGHAMLRAPIPLLATRFAGASPGRLKLMGLIEDGCTMAGLALSALIFGGEAAWFVPVGLGIFVAGGAAAFATVAMWRLER